MSDHVTMIHQGRVTLDSSLELINSSHHHSAFRFENTQDSMPTMEDAITISGEGRYWSAIHLGTPEAFQESLRKIGGEIVESRHATLEEVFVSRVGRESNIGAGSIEADA